MFQHAFSLIVTSCAKVSSNSNSHYDFEFCCCIESRYKERCLSSWRFVCCSSSMFVRCWFHMWCLFCHYLFLISPSFGVLGGGGRVGRGGGVEWGVGRGAMLCEYAIFWVFSLIQSTFNGSNIFGTMEIVRDIGTLCHWVLIITPGQEANGNILGMSFPSSLQYWSVEYNH